MIQGILLAAGSGSRFGADKLRQPLADGVPLALASARSLLQGVDQALAVVRPEQHALSGLLSEAGLQVRACEQARRGMGHSLACGIQASPAEVQGWIIALADMPWVRVHTIARLAGALREGASLVAPFHQGRRGNPVGFSRAYESELRALHGDQGARALLARHAHALQRIPCDDPGILRDVDRPGDLFHCP